MLDRRGAPYDLSALEVDVAVVGSGPAGLACAASLVDRGLDVVVLEQREGVGGAWRGRYRVLRLNSGRPFSHLPGLRFPRGTPMFPSRDEVIAHLEAFSAVHALPVHTGVRLSRLEQEGSRWRLVTDHGDLSAAQVVVATGLLAEPVLPDALAAPSTVPVVHSADYVDAAPYRGARVLVVGAGSSGFEIAHDLVAGAAGQVLLSVRTPPNILPRSVGGMSGDPAVLLLRHFPPRLADAPLRVMRRLIIGDLTAQGLPIPDHGPFTRLRDAGDDPAIVDREVLDDLRAGRVTVVPAVVGLDADGVHLADGSVQQVDAVVAATGFRPGLEPLVGHLGVLGADGIPTACDEQPALPGLHFVNFGLRPGLLMAAGRRGRRTAAAVAAASRGSRRSRRSAVPART